MADRKPTAAPPAVALSSGVVSALVTLACLLAIVALGWGYVRVLAPERRAAATAPATGFDPTPLRRAIEPGAVAAVQTQILALGSRYTGQPGAQRAEAFVRAAFQDAGLDVSEQRIRTVVPITSQREIRLAEGGSPLDGVEVYPLMPNHLQPVVTPPGGLTGRLVLLDQKTLATAPSLEDAIGVVDAGPGGIDPAYGYHWVRYARLGVKALIVAHRDGLGAVDWNLAAQRRSGLVSSVPVNFVRLAATPRIFEHLGRRVTLDVRVDFREVPTRTLFGLLRAPVPASEALFVSAPYDAPAVLPDLAPGGLPAVQLAVVLQLARGLAAKRETLKRDVVFVSGGSSVMGDDWLNQILRVAQFNTFGNRTNRLTDSLTPLSRDEGRDAGGSGAELTRDERLVPLEERAATERDRVDWTRGALSAFDEPRFLREPAFTGARIDALPKPARDFFLAEFAYVLHSVVFERKEPALQAKLAFERAGARDTGSPTFAVYRRARRALERASAMSGASPATLLQADPAYAREVDLRERMRRRLEELRAWHEERLRELASDRGVADLLSRYRVFDVLMPSFVPATSPTEKEILSLYAHSVQGTQSLELLLAAGARARDVGPGFGIDRMLPNQMELVENNCQPWPFGHYFLLYSTGYQGVGLVNFQRQDAYQKWAAPELSPFMRELGTLAGSFAATGELVLQVAHGNGVLSAPAGYPWQRRSYGGRVLVSNVGASFVPTFPLARALIGARSVDTEEQYSELGAWRLPFYMADPYGRFDLPEQAADFPGWWRTYSRGYAYTPIAVGYGGDGVIAYMKDEGDEIQGLFKSVDVPMGNQTAVANTTLVTFRAAPMSVVDLTNPQDFKDYSGVQMITKQGLTPFESRAEFVGRGFLTTFLAPDEHAKLLLQAGTKNNDNARETRAFMLGVSSTTPSDPTNVEASGNGYLVADHPFVSRVPLETARSMTWLNGQRLALQNRYGMADARTNAYHQKSVELLKSASSPALPAVEASQRARDAVSYAVLDHPVLRRSVLEAVIGILFYLALLVPFVFFAEKLLFCSADARRQLAAQAVIFVVVFGLLRLLHPAFQMVRSSLMILLGFVIILVTTGITLLFAGKVRENLDELRKREGKLRAAEVDTTGVLISSFLVGLNAMHRRRVRTGLTAATLTLLTFVMICFTSAQTDLVDETQTLGGAEYQGLLVKHDDFVPLSQSEVFALTSKFGERFPIAERRYYTGVQDWKERKRVNPSLSAAFESPSGARTAPFGSILKLTPEEPLRKRVRLLTNRGWFLPEHTADDGKPCPVLLPDRLAERLGVTVEAADAGELVVAINGKPFRVWGIFESASLDQLRDLDGRDILPFDIERVATASESIVGNVTVTTARADDPRIGAERIVVTPVRDLGFFIANSKELVGSVAVNLGGVGHRVARGAIDDHLERTAVAAYFGLDGVAYRGLRARQLTLAGLFDLLVPLLLAGLTVLNTMKGSVYERRGEIRVYNAVGIAPRYIAMMFLAEAMVYVVVGAVLGYLLSQGVGRVLTAYGLTGGLPMTFTSLATIYATLAIAAAVLLSTWFPARDALEIAAPAEESGWELPEPDGEDLVLELPFTFRPRGRLAVLAFFERWFSAHGEGSAGPFLASPPELRLGEEEDERGLSPELVLTVWLKPFDLAVSQGVTLRVPFDPKTGEYQARLHLHRASGTREAWLRLNRTFVTGLRRHFLHWRAVTEAEETEMLAEARALLEQRHPELLLREATG
jgi:hypothetical protein